MKPRRPSAEPPLILIASDQKSHTSGSNLSGSNSLAGQNLLVGSDPVVEAAKDHFPQRGYQVETCSDPASLLHRVHSDPPDLVLLDLINSAHGFGLLQQLSSHCRSVPVIVVSAEATLGMAVQATKLGAVDTVAKPPDLRQLHLVIDGIIKDQAQRRRDRLASLARGCDGFEMLGESPAMMDVLSLVHDVAETDATVLILGESGTGKELLARAIHKCSQRCDKRFVPVN